MAGNSATKEALLQWENINFKFWQACEQVRMLKLHIADKQVRYDRAVARDQRAWRYTLRLQLATMEGTLNMLYSYAYDKANQLEVLQRILAQEGLFLAESDDSSYDSD